MLLGKYCPEFFKEEINSLRKKINFIPSTEGEFSKPNFRFQSYYPLDKTTYIKDCFNIVANTILRTYGSSCELFANEITVEIEQSFHILENHTIEKRYFLLINLKCRKIVENPLTQEELEEISE